MTFFLIVVTLINIISGFKFTVDASIAYAANPEVSNFQLNKDTKVCGLIWIVTMVIIAVVFLTVGNQWL